MRLGDDDRQHCDEGDQQDETYQQLPPDAAGAHAMRWASPGASKLNGACIWAKHAADSRKIASIGLDRERLAKCWQCSRAPMLVRVVRFREERQRFAAKARS